MNPEGDYMWEDIIRKRSARETVERYDDYEFNDLVGSEFDYVIAGIKKLYYPYFRQDRQDRFNRRVSKAGDYINQFAYIKALRILKKIRYMVSQFKEGDVLPEFDYLIELLQIKGNER